MKNISRRDFLKGSAAMGVLATMSGISAASAETTHTYADTIKWDAEYDVVVMGMGAAGMVASKTAADNGAHVLIVEKMNEALSGGNTKVCGQLFAYANGDKEAAKTYYTALSGGREIPEAIVDTISEGVAHMADTLADEFGFNREEFQDWTGRPSIGEMSPEYPEMPGHEKMALWTIHDGVSDGYLYNGFKQNVMARTDKIDIWYESPAKKLIQDPNSKVVVGIQVERGSKLLNVRALNGVVLATGGFEANPDMVQHYLNIINYGARGGQYNTGDGIKMAQEIGADLWHMNCYEGLFGLGGAIWPTEIGKPCSMFSTLHQDAINTGASMLVGTDGHRFLNESEIVRHGHLYENGIWENPTFPEHVYYVCDETQMGLIKEAGLLSEEQLAAVKSYDTIEQLAEDTGMKPQVLKATIESFNSFAENGTDYAQGRSTEFMRAFDGKKYYAFYVMQGLLNTQGGPRRNEHAQVIDTHGDAIPHLYSAGECGGITVCMYQGGTNIAECITFGRIAGKNAAEKKEPLPAYDAGEVVESSPAKPGEITDVTAKAEYEAGENEYVGSASGMMGDVVTRVKVENGKIITVEVLEQNETEGIGSLALEEMPGRFVGCATSEEIDALDTVSGATVTSNALKEAVKAALTQVK